MKRTHTCFFCFLFQGVLCFGQGHINFANTPSLFVDDPSADRLVSCLEGGGLTGANWAAQLWYGIGSRLRYEQLTSVDPVAHFFAPGTGTAGTWDGGYRSLPGTTPGINQIVTIGVLFWDISRFPTWLDAVASGGPNASSILFSYTVPANDAPSDAFVMYGFQGFGFTCQVPEPLTPAFIVIGAALVFGYRIRARRHPTRGPRIVK